MAFEPGDRVKLTYRSSDLSWLAECARTEDREYVRELIASGDPIVGTVLRMQNGLVHVLFDDFRHHVRPEGRYQVEASDFMLWTDPETPTDEALLTQAEEAYVADGNPPLESTDKAERCEALALAGYLSVNAWFIRGAVKLGVRITEKDKPHTSRLL